MMRFFYGEIGQIFKICPIFPKELNSLEPDSLPFTSFARTPSATAHKVSPAFPLVAMLAQTNSSEHRDIVSVLAPRHCAQDA